MRTLKISILAACVVAAGRSWTSAMASDPASHRRSPCIRDRVAGRAHEIAVMGIYDPDKKVTVGLRAAGGP